MTRNERKVDGARERASGIKSHITHSVLHIHTTPRATEKHKISIKWHIPTRKQGHMKLTEIMEKQKENTHTNRNERNEKKKYLRT